MILNNKPIAILLSAYNGSMYLAQQLDSLLYQTNQQFNIYIRDDGSTDNTVELIEKFCDNNDNIYHLTTDKSNKGAKGSFEYLLSHVESNYYMFCDQDDVWLPNKIELTYNRIVEVENKNTPTIVLTDLQVVDQELNQKEPSMWKSSKINPALLQNFKYLSVFNLATGCTMMINRYAKEICLPFPQNAIMHDCWICLKVAFARGVISYIPQPTILYRQHHKNVIGAEKANMQFYAKKLTSLKAVLSTNKKMWLMSNELKKSSIFVYIINKIAYLIQR